MDRMSFYQSSFVINFDVQQSKMIPMLCMFACALAHACVHTSSFNTIGYSQILSLPYTCYVHFAWFQNIGIMIAFALKYCNHWEMTGLLNIKTAHTESRNISLLVHVLIVFQIQVPCPSCVVGFCLFGLIWLIPMEYLFSISTPNWLLLLQIKLLFQVFHVFILYLITLPISLITSKRTLSASWLFF